MPRYDLIYVGFLDRLAARLGYGAAKHGEGNYERGVGDAAYRRDRINHLIAHAHKLAAATDPADIDKHLGAIAANCQIVAFWMMPRIVVWLRYRPANRPRRSVMRMSKTDRRLI